MSTHRRPSSLDGIKRLAKKISSESGKPRSEALNLAAQAAGFQNYKNAQNRLARGVPLAHRHTVATEQEFPFHGRSLRRWITGVREVNPTGAASRAWETPAAIMGALQPFLGQNHNHAHLPTGGGHDVLAVASSVEPGCIELTISRGLAYIVRPKRLTLEIIAGAPAESFLLLELSPLGRTGVYDDELAQLTQDEQAYIQASEELLEIAPGQYEDRRYWDDNEGPGGEPLPEAARLVVRWMSGQILFVAKGSLWNGSPRTYRGAHNTLTAAEIRAEIERVALQPA